MLADYLDRNLYAGKTFAELAHQPRPFIALNATDISLGAQFVFSQHYFDLICSDLSAVTLGRAVAASAAAPPFFSPITLWNYAGTCGYAPPPYLTGSVHGNTRRTHDRQEVLSYLDARNRPYVHLMDGGLIDNLGVRQALGEVLRRGSIGATLQALGYSDAAYVVFISVDAEHEPSFDLDRSADVPGPITSASAMRNIVGFNSFDASVQAHDATRAWEREMRSVRTPGEPPAEFFFIDVSLHAIKDPATRRRVAAIPTTLQLSRAQVDELRAFAGTLLRESPDFQRLMAHIGTSAAAQPAAVSAGPAPPQPAPGTPAQR